MKKLLRKSKLAIQNFILNTLEDSLMWKALVGEVTGQAEAIDCLATNVEDANNDVSNLKQISDVHSTMISASNGILFGIQKDLEKYNK